MNTGTWSLADVCATPPVVDLELISHWVDGAYHWCPSCGLHVSGFMALADVVDMNFVHLLLVSATDRCLSLLYSYRPTMIDLPGRCHVASSVIFDCGAIQIAYWRREWWSYAFIIFRQYTFLLFSFRVFLGGIILYPFSKVNKQLGVAYPSDSSQVCTLTEIRALWLSAIGFQNMEWIPSTQSENGHRQRPESCGSRLKQDPNVDNK